MRVKDEPEQAELHMDFCYPGEENNDKKLTVLVVRKGQTRMTLSSGVPSKSNGEFMAKRVVAFMREIGIDKGDITAKTDQEPAMLAALSEIARHRAAAGGGRLVPEHSPVEDSKGNGVTQRAVKKSVEAQIRVARSALEGRIRARLEPDHPVFPWLT